MDWRRVGKRVWVLGGGLWALTGCPSGDAGVGVTSTASEGMAPGSTGAAESSTGADTLADGSGGGTTAAPTVEVGCGEMPAAALEAEYAHAFEVDPPDASGDWSVEGLPEGMSFSPFGGELSGIPTEEGTFELTVSVDGSAGMGEATCMLDVGPALSADLSVLARPCLGPGDSLTDILVGGDGSELTCTTPAGNGSGARPEGVTVNEDTCAIEGEPTPDEWGTWVWITQVRQAGARVHVPFCITQDTPPADSFDVTMTRRGDTDVLLEPLVGTFSAAEPLAFGGDGNPRFEVTGGCGGGACFYGFSFNAGASPFGGDCGQDSCLGLAPSAIVVDKTDGPIGFSHELYAFGPPVDDNFVARPFVMPWELTYCIADNDTECDGSEAILANAGAHVHVSLLMLPE
ncbi:MAG: putative Ig domain-containing protein [Nannocystales bacterium]